MFLKDLDKDGAKSVFALVREEGLRRGYEASGLRVGQGLMEGEEPDKVYVFLKRVQSQYFHLLPKRPAFEKTDKKIEEQIRKEVSSQ